MSLSKKSDYAHQLSLTSKERPVLSGRADEVTNTNDDSFQQPTNSESFDHFQDQAKGLVFIKKAKGSPKKSMVGKASKK